MNKRERPISHWHASLLDIKQAWFNAGLAVDEAGGFRLLWAIYLGTPLYHFDNWVRDQVCLLRGHKLADVGEASPERGEIKIVCLRCGKILGQRWLY